MDGLTECLPAIKSYYVLFTTRPSWPPCGVVFRGTKNGMRLFTLHIYLILHVTGLFIGHPFTKDIVQLVMVTLSLYLLGVHTEVDEGIEGRVGHGQPEEGQEHVLGVLVTHHRLKYILVILHSIKLRRSTGKMSLYISSS